MTRALALALVALLASAACGKYGPPIRTTEASPPRAAKPAAPAPDTQETNPGKTDTEKSQDPNAPKPPETAP